MTGFGGGSHQHGLFGEHWAAEDAAVAFDGVCWPGGFIGVVAQLDGGNAVGAGELADQADGLEGVLAARMTFAEVVGEQRAPASGEADAAVEVLMQADDLGGVETVGGDEALAARVLTAACAV